jgi:hypothetical protein
MSELVLRIPYNNQKNEGNNSILFLFHLRSALALMPANHQVFLYIQN